MQKVTRRGVGVAWRLHRRAGCVPQSRAMVRGGLAPRRSATAPAHPTQPAAGRLTSPRLGSLCGQPCCPAGAARLRSAIAPGFLGPGICQPSESRWVWRRFWLAFIGQPPPRERCAEQAPLPRQAAAQPGCARPVPRLALTRLRLRAGQAARRRGIAPRVSARRARLAGNAQCAPCRLGLRPSPIRL